jgi:hypothetical protein
MAIDWIERRIITRRHNNFKLDKFLIYNDFYEPAIHSILTIVYSINKRRYMLNIDLCSNSLTYTDAIVPLNYSNYFLCTIKNKIILCSYVTTNIQDIAIVTNVYNIIYESISKFFPEMQLVENKIIIPNFTEFDIITVKNTTVKYFNNRLSLIPYISTL